MAPGIPGLLHGVIGHRSQARKAYAYHSNMIGGHVHETSLEVLDSAQDTHETGNEHWSLVVEGAALHWQAADMHAD